MYANNLLDIWCIPVDHTRLRLAWRVVGKRAVWTTARNSRIGKPHEAVLFLPELKQALGRLPFGNVVAFVEDLVL